VPCQSRARSRSPSHGGLGSPQTEWFTLRPVELPLPDQPIVEAAAVHDLLVG
jgi:hypothetical protein